MLKIRYGCLTQRNKVTYQPVKLSFRSTSVQLYKFDSLNLIKQQKQIGLVSRQPNVQSKLHKPVTTLSHSIRVLRATNDGTQQSAIESSQDNLKDSNNNSQSDSKKNEDSSDLNSESQQDSSSSDTNRTAASTEAQVNEEQPQPATSNLKVAQPIPFIKLPLALFKSVYYSVVFFCLPQAQFSKYISLVRTRRALMANPNDTQSYAKLLKLHNASNPHRTIDLYEKQKYATDDNCVAEYIKALVHTNRINRYLPGSSDNKLATQMGVQSGPVGPLALHQLLEQLKNQTQGGRQVEGQGPPAGAIGSAQGPLQVQVVNGSNFVGKTQNNQPFLMRVLGFFVSNFFFVTAVMFLWIFGLEILVRRNSVTPNNLKVNDQQMSQSVNNQSPYSPKEYNKDEVPIKSQKTFKDVLGCDESKEELEEVVQFLKNPQKFKSMGASLPKGVLLTGPPGTGKTLLAKAVAGEANVPFFYRAGSEFEEMFVGVGARRVRELFKAAKKKAPCIVFVDEIDSVGGSRKNVHNHRKTLNQFLSEMDGFEENTGVIVMAATNLPETLDQALVRPGRFDRIISVPLPDVNGREQILKYYLNEKPVKENVDCYYLAQQTKYFSGADLNNLVNESALQAAKMDSQQITLEHLDYARDKIMMGKERRSLKQSIQAKQKTAIHESGHALVNVYTKGARLLYKATIIPRGSSLGMVTTLPKTEDYNSTRQQMIADIDVALGGYVAEEISYGPENVTNGASSDLKKATKLARSMICDYGMSDLGIMYLNYEKISPDQRYKVDSEINTILTQAKQRVTSILTEKNTELNSLAKALYEYETLSLDEIQEAIKGNFNPKHRQKPSAISQTQVPQQQPQPAFVDT